MNIGKSIGIGIMVGCVAAWGYIITPEYVLFPDREAPMRYYYDAKRVFNETETKEYGDGESYTQTYTGACPDLSLMTAKALGDKKLTIREVHDLGKESLRLFNTAEEVSRRNEALKAAGQKITDSNIQCEHGDELFQNL